MYQSQNTKSPELVFRALLTEACANEGVRYVALKPPTTLTRGDGEPQLVPIREFIDHVLGE